MDGPLCGTGWIAAAEIAAVSRPATEQTHAEGHASLFVGRGGSKEVKEDSRPGRFAAMGHIPLWYRFSDDIQEREKI
jgi:hypothetical protein